MTTVSNGDFHNFKTRAIFFGIAFIFSQAGIIFILGSASDALLELQVSFSTDHFYDILHGISSEQYAALLNHFYLDFIHPFIYGAALFFWLKALRVGQTFSLAWLILPWVSSLADLIENCIELFLFTHLDARFPTAVIIAASFSTLKWASAFLSLLAIAMFTNRINSRSFR